MVQIRNPRRRRVKECAADEFVQEGDDLPKKKRGRKTLLSRLKKGSGSKLDTREPSRKGGDSTDHDTREVDDEREPPPQAPPSAPSSPSNSSIGSRGSTNPWARRKQSLRSNGTNDRSVEVVLQEPTPKKKRSKWLPKTKSEGSTGHESHSLPDCDNVQAPTDAARGEESIEAVDASVMAQDQVNNTDRTCLYHVYLTPAILAGLVASAKQSSTESSARCYLRIVSKVDLVDDCPGIVKSLPYQLDMGADDKKRGGKNVVVLWPSNTLTTSIGTITYATTKADIKAFGGFDLEVGVESDEELLPLGSTTLYLVDTEAREEQVTLKIKPLIGKSPTKSPKGLKRLFRGGKEKKTDARVYLDETALINIVLDVVRVQDQNEEVEEAQPRSSSWLNSGNGPLLNMLLNTFSKDQEANRHVDHTDKTRGEGEIVGPVTSGPFSCCSDTVNVEDDSSLITAKEIPPDNMEVNKGIEADVTQAVTPKLTNKTPGVAESDDHTYGEETVAVTEIGGATTTTDPGISQGGGWTMGPAGASMAMCSFFSCCLGRSVAKKSESLPTIQNKSLSVEKQNTTVTTTVDSKTSSIDDGTERESIDLPKASNNNTEDLTLVVNGSNNTDDSGAVMMANSPLCSPCCSPCGSGNGSEEETNHEEGGVLEEDLKPFGMGAESLGTSPKGSNRLNPNDLHERSRSSRSASSTQAAQILKEKGSSKDCAPSYPLRDDDSVYALKHGKSPPRAAPSIDESSEAEKDEDLSPKTTSKAATTVADDEVDIGIQESSSDAPANICVRFCGEEDVANVRPPTDAPQPISIETQLSHEQTPLIASLCMTCLGDEDVTKVRPVASHVFSAPAPTDAAAEEIDTLKSGSSQSRKSFEESSIQKVMGPDRTEDEERSARASQSIDIEISSSYETQEESYDQGLSIGNSTGTSLYSKDQRLQAGWFSFFGGFGATSAQTASEDEHSTYTSPYSAETGSFSQDTN